MTSHMEDPLDLVGRQETRTLEFKSADSLKEPSRIAREVVAMLNAKGGAVWVGIPEINGRAAHPESIPDVDQTREALRNTLLDTIEPSPTDDEVRCEVRGGVIRVVVKGNGPGRPYALRKDQGRQFWIRVDNIVREMSRPELVRAFNGESRSDQDEADQAKRRLDEDWLTEHRRGRQRFWCELIPVPRLAVDARNAADGKFLQTLLTDPKASGNRSNGWSIVYFHDRLPKIRSDGSVMHTFGEGKNEHVAEIGADGAMTFAIPRSRLERDWDEEGIFPFALVEFPVSAFRVAACVLEHFAGAETEGSSVICSAAMGDIPGARLRPGSPNQPLLPWKQFGGLREDRFLVNHLVIQASELISNPDAAAYRLIWAIYEQFQLDEEDIPLEFDRKDKILRLP